MSGQYVFNYAFLSIADLCKDTSQPNQLAAGIEDIEMGAPPASVPEIAATIFAEMQKHMLNGKHVNCTPWYPISFCDSASMQPLSHSPGNTHLDTNDIDALPVSYKKKAPKSRERNAFHVRVTGYFYFC